MLDKVSDSRLKLLLNKIKMTDETKAPEVPVEEPKEEVKVETPVEETKVEGTEPTFK